MGCLIWNIHWQQRSIDRIMETVMVYDVLPSPNCFDMSSVNSMLIRHERQDVFTWLGTKSSRCPTLNRTSVDAIVFVFEGYNFFFLDICGEGIPDLRGFVSLDLCSVMKFNTSAV